MELFRGSGVAMITPMNEDYSIDYDSFRTLCKYLIDGNTKALIVNGTTGESPTIQEEELVKLVEIAKEEAKGIVPIIVGTGSNNTEHVIKLCKLVEDKGADGYLIVTPYYNKTTQAGLVDHYTYIADHVNKPIILYDVPARTNLTMSIDTILTLSKHPNIVGLKDATGDLKHSMELLKALRNKSLDFYLYTGEDWNTYSYLTLGGSGIISVLGNIYPRINQKLCDLVFEGNLEEARNLALDLLDVNNTLFLDVSPMNVKTALAYKGLCKDVLRRPLVKTDEVNKLKIIEVLNKFEEMEH